LTPEVAGPGVFARVGRQLARRRRPLTVALSLAGHLLVLLVLLAPRPDLPEATESSPIVVSLVRPPPPPEPMVEPTPAPKPPEPAPAKAPARRTIFRAAPVPPDVAPLPAGDARTAQAGVELSDAQLAGAATAGSGRSGGDCDMPAHLQGALRRNARVRAAAANAHSGRPILVWNGDWVRRADQDGAGLAAVREVMQWEIAFAPEACRAEPVRGLVLLSLDDGPGAARLVVGSDRWRWSDLLFSRTGGGALR
jgi:hypothetical protein